MHSDYRVMSPVRNLSLPARCAVVWCMPLDSNQLPAAHRAVAHPHELRMHFPECRSGVEPLMESGHSGVRLPSQRHMFGTQGGIRTHKLLGLNEATLPICPLGLKLVRRGRNRTSCPVGIWFTARRQATRPYCTTHANRSTRGCRDITFLGM